MGSKMVFYQFDSEKSIDEVREAAIKAFTPLGGQIAPLGNGLIIKDGKEGVQFGFAANFEATISITESKPGKFNLNCAINWKMSTLTIVCLVVGIFVFGILWVVPLLFLFIDPSQVYQNALISVNSYL